MAISTNELGRETSPFLSGERQVSPTLDGIRADHVNRYRWVIPYLNGSVIDAACGIGYGSWMMAQAGLYVRAIERNREAIEYGEKYYSHKNLTRQCVDLNHAILKTDPVVAFEIIEHIEDPLPFLSRCSNTLYASVPNETVFPYRNYKFHYRHYTKDEFEQLLNKAGYTVQSWYGQEGVESEVKQGVEGRTLIAIATR